MSRRHSKEQLLKRRKPHRDPKETFLIFCEGENTEPYYFTSFRLKSASIKPISIRNSNAPAFVKEAVKQKNKLEEFDQYWIVIDKDNNKDLDFDKALKLATDNGFKVAYSNCSFEFWYLCHFAHSAANMSQKRLESELTGHLNQKYSKDARFARSLYHLLKDKQASAISNATKAIKHHKDKSPSKACSSTRVHDLVMELNKFL